VLLADGFDLGLEVGGDGVSAMVGPAVASQRAEPATELAPTTIQHSTIFTLGCCLHITASAPKPNIAYSV